MDKTAGVRLREDLDKALAAAARQQGRALEWDEREVLTLEMAAEAADRCVELRRCWPPCWPARGLPRTRPRRWPAS